jgi:hypothetical protein
VAEPCRRDWRSTMEVLYVVPYKGRGRDRICQAICVKIRLCTALKWGGR